MPANIAAIIYVNFVLCIGAAYIFIAYKKQSVFFCLFIWSSITIVAFISGTFWILFFFLILMSTVLLTRYRQDVLPYYFMALPVLPLNLYYTIRSPIPGTQNLLVVDYNRLLSLFILVPLFIRFLVGWYFSKLFYSKRIRLIESSTDFLIILYSVFLYLLSFRDAPTITSALKNVIYISLMMTCPYYVISRNLLSLSDFKKIFFAILYTSIFISLIALLQMVLDWNLYSILQASLGMDKSSFFFIKDYRNGFLRVESTMGNPSVLGYFIVLSVGVFLFLRKQANSKNVLTVFSIFLFFAVLFFTGSRGPWIGCVALIFLFWFLSVINIDLIGVYLAPFILLMGVAGLFVKKLLALDPYGTFNYRIALIQNALIVIKKNLWLGSPDFSESAELEAMRQGQGIIDIVNSYLQIVLHSGIIGLSIFLLIFFILLFQIFQRLKKISYKNHPEYFYLGTFFFSSLIATMLVISTVSSIHYIPVYYWSLIGLSSAYLRLTKNNSILFSENRIPNQPISVYQP